MNTSKEHNGNHQNKGGGDSDLALLTLSYLVFFLLTAIFLYGQACETEKVGETCAGT